MWQYNWQYGWYYVPAGPSIYGADYRYTSGNTSVAYSFYGGWLSAYGATNHNLYLVSYGGSISTQSTCGGSTSAQMFGSGRVYIGYMNQGSYEVNHYGNWGQVVLDNVNSWGRVYVNNADVSGWGLNGYLNINKSGYGNIDLSSSYGSLVINHSGYGGNVNLWNIRGGIINVTNANVQAYYVGGPVYINKSGSGTVSIDQIRDGYWGYFNVVHAGYSGRVSVRNVNAGGYIQTNEADIDVSNVYGYNGYTGISLVKYRDGTIDLNNLYNTSYTISHYGSNGRVNISNAGGYGNVYLSGNNSSVKLNSIQGSLSLYKNGSYGNIEINGTGTGSYLNIYSGGGSIYARDTSGSLSLNAGGGTSFINIQSASGAINISSSSSGGAIDVSDSRGTTTISVNGADVRVANQSTIDNQLGVNKQGDGSITVNNGGRLNIYHWGRGNVDLQGLSVTAQLSQPGISTYLAGSNSRLKVDWRDTLVKFDATADTVKADLGSRSSEASVKGRGITVSASAATKLLLGWSGGGALSVALGSMQDAVYFTAESAASNVNLSSARFSLGSGDDIFSQSGFMQSLYQANAGTLGKPTLASQGALQIDLGSGNDVFFSGNATAEVSGDGGNKTYYYAVGDSSFKVTQQSGAVRVVFDVAELAQLKLQGAQGALDSYDFIVSKQADGYSLVKVIYQGTSANGGVLIKTTQLGATTFELDDGLGRHTVSREVFAAAQPGYKPALAQEVDVLQLISALSKSVATASSPSFLSVASVLSLSATAISKLSGQELRSLSFDPSTLKNLSQSQLSAITPDFFHFVTAAQLNAPDFKILNSAQFSAISSSEFAYLSAETLQKQILAGAAKQMTDAQFDVLLRAGTTGKLTPQTLSSLVDSIASTRDFVLTAEQAQKLITSIPGGAAGAAFHNALAATIMPKLQGTSAYQVVLNGVIGMMSLAEISRLTAYDLTLIAPGTVLSKEQISAIDPEQLAVLSPEVRGSLLGGHLEEQLSTKQIYTIRAARVTDIMPAGQYETVAKLSQDLLQFLNIENQFITEIDTALKNYDDMAFKQVLQNYQKTATPQAYRMGYTIATLARQIYGYLAINPTYANVLNTLSGYPSLDFVKSAEVYKNIANIATTRHWGQVTRAIAAFPRIIASLGFNLRDAAANPDNNAKQVNANFSIVYDFISSSKPFFNFIAENPKLKQPSTWFSSYVTQVDKIENGAKEVSVKSYKPTVTGFNGLRDITKEIKVSNVLLAIQEYENFIDFSTKEKNLLSDLKTHIRNNNNLNGFSSEIDLKSRFHDQSALFQPLDSTAQKNSAYALIEASEKKLDEGLTAYNADLKKASSAGQKIRGGIWMAASTVSTAYGIYNIIKTSSELQNAKTQNETIIQSLTLASNVSMLAYFGLNLYAESIYTLRAKYFATPKGASQFNKLQAMGVIANTIGYGLQLAATGVSTDWKDPASKAQFANSTIEFGVMVTLEALTVALNLNPWTAALALLLPNIGSAVLAARQADQIKILDAVDQLFHVPQNDSMLSAGVGLFGKGDKYSGYQLFGVLREIMDAGYLSNALGAVPIINIFAAAVTAGQSARVRDFAIRNAGVFSGVLDNSIDKNYVSERSLALLNLVKTYTIESFLYSRLTNGLIDQYGDRMDADVDAVLKENLNLLLNLGKSSSPDKSFYLLSTQSANAVDGTPIVNDIKFDSMNVLFSTVPLNFQEINKRPLNGSLVLEPDISKYSAFELVDKKGDVIAGQPDYIDVAEISKSLSSALKTTSNSDNVYSVRVLGNSSYWLSSASNKSSTLIWMSTGNNSGAWHGADQDDVFLITDNATLTNFTNGRLVLDGGGGKNQVVSYINYKPSPRISTSIASAPTPISSKSELDALYTAADNLENVTFDDFIKAFKFFDKGGTTSLVKSQEGLRDYLIKNGYKNALKQNAGSQYKKFVETVDKKEWGDFLKDFNDISDIYTQIQPRSYETKAGFDPFAANGVDIWADYAPDKAVKNWNSNVLPYEEKRLDVMKLIAQYAIEYGGTIDVGPVYELSGANFSSTSNFSQMTFSFPLENRDAVIFYKNPLQGKVSIDSAGTVYGSDGDESISGTVLYGLGGDDVLRPVGGATYVDGGTGLNKLDLNRLFDGLKDSSGSQIDISGKQLYEVVDVNGNLTLKGSGISDLVGKNFQALSLSDADDSLKLRAPNDVISVVTTGAGNDTVWVEGAGAHTIFLAPTDGSTNWGQKKVVLSYSDGNYIDGGFSDDNVVIARSITSSGPYASYVQDSDVSGGLAAASVFMKGGTGNNIFDATGSVGAFAFNLDASAQNTIFASDDWNEYDIRLGEWSGNALSSPLNSTHIFLSGAVQGTTAKNTTNNFNLLIDRDFSTFEISSPDFFSINKIGFSNNAILSTPDYLGGATPTSSTSSPRITADIFELRLQGRAVADFYVPPVTSSGMLENWSVNILNKDKQVVTSLAVLALPIQ